MDAEESRAAKMRQAVDDAKIVINATSLALAAVVFDTAPWTDEESVARSLRSWANAHWGEGALQPGLADGAGQVAEHMRVLGSAVEPPTPNQMLGIAFQMLWNVAAGRGPVEYDTLLQHIIGLPARTMRRYRQLARESGENPDMVAISYAFARIQYEIDLAALMKAGRTEAAARRWLQRNPGKHAKDAPPPRSARERPDPRPWTYPGPSE